MKKEDVKYGAYVQILKEELVPAMGYRANRTCICRGESKRNTGEYSG